MNTIQKIAEALSEIEPGPLRAIKRVVMVLGEDRAQALLEQTHQIEAAGGLPTEDGAQRRTPGGVYFKLVKSQTKPKERWAIFGPLRAAATPRAKPQPLTWKECAALVTELLKSTQGEATTVKTTLIGRPGRVIEKENLVITSLQSGKVPSLPKELPQPPTEPTTYVVYIAHKQWNKVKDSLSRYPDDKLIVEGYPVFDKRIGQSGAMTVYAQNTTTKLLEQAKREQQKATARK